MKAIVSVLVIATSVICLHGSGGENSWCLDPFFKCLIHGATPEEYYNNSVACCQKLLTNETYSFLQTYNGCFWEAIEKNVFLKCLEASGRFCKRFIPKILAKDLIDYVTFNTKAIVIAKPPSDPKGCGKFVKDYGTAYYDLCLNNTKKDLKPMCNAIIKTLNLY